jgi:hypothetical protein
LPIEDTLNAPWLGEYVVELVGFPGTKHGDQVDSTMQALHYLREPNVGATFIKFVTNSLAEAPKFQDGQ